MTKKKNTPGPWRVDPVVRTLVVGTADPMPIVADTEAASPFDVETDAANARLIAAAPELLARLEDCAHQLRQAWACIEHIKEHAPDYERKASIETLKAIQMVGNDAEAAIAKATGGDDK